MAKFKYSVTVEELKTRPLAEIKTEEVSLRAEKKASKEIYYDSDVGLCINYTEWDEFQLALFETPKGWEIVTWTDLGHQNLGRWVLDSNIERVPEDTINDIELVFDKYLGGKVRCICCGTWVAKDTPYRFYAGTYCPECWGTHIRAEALRDNHE